MGVSKGMAVIGCEEMMQDRFGGESVRGEEMPHPLTISGLEMMRSTVRPDVDDVESVIEVVIAEELEPCM